MSGTSIPGTGSAAGSARRRLFVLYHELRREAGTYRYAMTTGEFRRQMEMVGRLQREGVGLRPEVTFDDGHGSNATEALPVMADAGVRAWFFLTAGWMGKRAGYLGWDQVRSIRASGHEVGAHGMTHAMLTHCEGASLDEELRGARERLEDGMGARVRTMSLPGGRYDRRVLEACRTAGYEQVFTSEPRAVVWDVGGRGPEVVGRLNLRSDATAEWMERLLDPASGVLRRMEWMDRAKGAAKRVMGDGLYRRVWVVVNRADGAGLREEGAGGDREGDVA